jgi:signal transduction histidine kinase
LDKPLGRLSLRQSLALWTLVPMITFGSIVVLLSFGWAWRNAQEVASEHNIGLAYAVAISLGERLASGTDGAIDQVCAASRSMSQRLRGTVEIVDREGNVLCEAQSVGPVVRSPGAYDLETLRGDRGAEPVATTLREPGHIVSYAAIPNSSWGVIVQESRSELLSPTYSFLIAITAFTVVALFISFWLLWVGFNRISWPLSAVTEQARRVAAGNPFVPPDVEGPSDVEALVAALNLMVTELRQQRDTLHEYATRMLHSQEEERKRISRDLHDETAQDLVGLMQRIDLCRLSADGNPQLLEALDELADLVDRTLAGVRRTSRALRPLILEDLGLVAAVQAIGDDLEQQLPDGRVFCEIIGQEQRLSPEVELTAFRVVQEALTNVRKHAPGASRVYVTFQFESDLLRVVVEDNGPGFRTPVTRGNANGDHLGLMGMRERAELLNGKWEIHSEVGQGTRMTLEIALADLPATVALGADE